MTEEERTTLISELWVEIRKLKQEIGERETELQIWYDNAIIVISEEKQVFYRMYRTAQKQKREEEQRKLAEELKKISTRIYSVTKKEGSKHEEAI